MYVEIKGVTCNENKQQNMIIHGLHHCLPKSTFRGYKKSRFSISSNEQSIERGEFLYHNPYVNMDHLLL